MIEEEAKWTLIYLSIFTSLYCICEFSFLSNHRKWTMPCYYGYSNSTDEETINCSSNFLPTMAERNF